MRYLILGAAGFIGSNLAQKLLKETNAYIILFDRKKADFAKITDGHPSERYEIKEGNFCTDIDFEALTEGVDVIYHLISTTIPGDSNNHIAKGLMENVVTTSLLLDACVKNNIQKVIFLSSGGTVYGVENKIPFHEDNKTNPISAYGLQKITIEKLLYLFYSMYQLDYRVIRLSNPYGTYQKPNAVQGVVTTFAYKAMRDESLTVYGDGTIIRDFIYIDDAICGIRRVEDYQGDLKIFNIGSGTGYSIKQVIETIEKVLHKKADVQYRFGRKEDVPINILNISRYEENCGPLKTISLEQGIRNTCDYLKMI